MLIVLYFSKPEQILGKFMINTMRVFIRTPLRIEFTSIREDLKSNFLEAETEYEWCIMDISL